MNTKLLYSLFLLLTAATLARAQGTAFTYQGRLNLDGAPVNGAYDFRVNLASLPGDAHEIHIAAE